MDGLAIRRATPGDKQAIIDIRADIYDGFDYLEDRYDDYFMDNPNMKPYVAVYNNEIVGFAAANMVDGGATVVSTAGRVKPGFSGRRIYKRLNQHCLEVSGASVNAFTAINTNTALSTTSFKKENSLVLTRPLTRYDLFIPGLQLISGDDVNSICLKHLTESTLQEYFTGVAYSQYLFPNKRFVSNLVPYKLRQSNTSLILKTDHRYLRVTDIRSDGDRTLGLLTMSNIYTAANGASVYMLDIFGTDTTSLKCHLLSQMKFLSEISVGKTVVMVFTDTGLETSALEKTFEEIAGLKKTLWKSPDNPESTFSTLCLFEKSIHPNTAAQMKFT